MSRLRYSYSLASKGYRTTKGDRGMPRGLLSSFGAVAADIE